MGADHFAAYVGIKREVTDETEVEQLELDKHPLVLAATAAGLEHMWDKAWESREGEGYYLLIGVKLGVFGAEDADHAAISSADLLEAMEKARAGLAAAGIREEPMLHLQFGPDW